jgi:hypothetical protein
MKVVKFEDVPGESLRYGNPCKKNGHIGPDGKNIRRMSDGWCLACTKKVAPGPFTKLFEGVKDCAVNKIYATKEESMAAHIVRVRDWQRRNPDKVKKTQKKYEQTEERRQNHKDWYAALSDERKEEVLKYQREYSKRKYASMTPEQKRAFLDNQKANVLKRKAAKEQEEQNVNTI